MLHVSGATIAATILLLIICFILPLVLFYVLYKFADGKIKNLLTGAAAFFVGGFILDTLALHLVSMLSDISKNMPVYFLYTLLISPAIFLLTGFVAIKCFGKEMKNTGDALMYTVGYVGLQNILLVGIGEFMNLLNMFSMNSSNGYVVVSDSNYASYSDIVSASNLISESGYEYLVNLSGRSASYVLAMCVDRLWIFAAYGAVMLVIWLAVRKQGGLPLLAAAFGMRMLITVPSILSELKVITNAWIIIPIAIAITVVIWFAAIALWKKHIDRANIE